MIELVRISRTYHRLMSDMAAHYSQPKGFVGRNICYAIAHDNTYYGAIVGGSATLHLPGRDQFFSLAKDTKQQGLLGIVNNIFFHIDRRGGNIPSATYPRLYLVCGEQE